jgi:hypothetical protein
LEHAETLLGFLDYTDRTGLMASTIRTYAAAISATAAPISGSPPLGQDPDVIRLLGSLKRHGSRTHRDNAMWDLGEALKSLSEMKGRDILFLAKKTAFLLAIASCWRPASDLERISFRSIRFTENAVSFSAHNVKEAASKSVRIVAFSDCRVCPVRTLQDYIEATAIDIIYWPTIIEPRPPVRPKNEHWAVLTRKL